jgi:hypothetical protein
VERAPRAIPECAGLTGRRGRPARGGETGGGRWATEARC